MSGTRYELLVESLGRVEAEEASRPSEPDRRPVPWESSMQASCDCLAWRGTLATLERRRAEDELGQTLYSGFPVHARPALVAAHLLIDKGIITEEELEAKMKHVRARLQEA